MSGFSERRDAITDIAFETFGAPAEWEGIDKLVLVRSKKRNEDDGFAAARLVTTSTIIRVRQSDVPEPQVGGVVRVLSGRLAGDYLLRRGAMLDSRGVWDCPVDAAPAGRLP